MNMIKIGVSGSSLLPVLALWALPVVVTMPSARADDLTSASSLHLTGPLPASAPNFSQWVITFVDPQSKDKAASTPAANAGTRMIVTTKTGQTVHVEIVYGSGASFNEWYVGSTLYSKSSGSPSWNQTKSGREATYVPLTASGFHDLNWITPQTYVGTATASGRSCLVFVPGPPRKIDLADPTQLDTLNTYAFLDAETRLPVKVRTAGQTSFYQFKDAPTEPLVLPPDLADQLKRNQEALERLVQPMPRPY